MYYSIFSLFEYYWEEDEHSDDIVDKVCIICWLPEDNNYELTKMKNLKNIMTVCKCNPHIHNICLHKWIEQTKTCPICRKMMTIQIYEDRNVFIRWYFYCIGYTANIIKLFYYASFINMMCVIFYNVYYIFYFTKAYDYEEN